MTAAPRVSVVMPVFNAELYLQDALESVLAQTLENLELVAVDDGSRDSSREILERFAVSDSRVRVVVNRHNQGISAALNRGWHAARAPYIARLDADDVALPERLDRQAAFLDGHRTIAVVGTAAVTIDQSGTRIATMQFPTESRVIRSTLARHNCMAHPSVMLRRAALEEVGGYRFDNGEDYDLWLRLSERFDLANLPEPLILYRVHTGQVTVGSLEERVMGALAVRAAARSRRASGIDPLAGVQRVTAATLDALEVSRAERSHALELELLSWAALLADVGRLDEAAELVDRATSLIGRRATRAIAAAKELREADAHHRAGRPLSASLYVLRALRFEPRYTSLRLAARLRDRIALP